MAPPLELDEYLTASNLRVLLIGAGAGALSVGLLQLLRRPPAWLAGVAGPLLALAATGWWEWPDPSLERLVAVVVVGLVAGAGHERLRAAGRSFVAPLVLVACAGGVWLAVPENDPVAAVAGVVAGLAVVGRATSPGVGYGLAAAVAWSVLLGGGAGDWPFVGGLLCLSPLVAVALLSVSPWRRRGCLPAWPWLAIGSAAVAFASARWIGVAPDATWLRVAVVGAGAAGLAVVTRA